MTRGAVVVMARQLPVILINLTRGKKKTGIEISREKAVDGTAAAEPVAVETQAPVLMVRIILIPKNRLIETFGKRWSIGARGSMQKTI